MEEQQPQPTTQPEKPKKRFYINWWYITLIVLILVIGIGVWAIFIQKDNTTDNTISTNSTKEQPNAQLVNGDLTKCDNLSFEKNVVTLEMLNNNLVLANDISNLDQTSVDKILTAVQPYIRPVTGYEYSSASMVLISPERDNENKLAVYVRTSTEKKSLLKNLLNSESTTIYSHHDFFYDYNHTGFNDHGFYVYYNMNDGIVEKIETTYFSGRDLPDSLAECSIAILQEDEGYRSFKQNNNQFQIGLQGWQMANPSEGIEDDLIVALAIIDHPNGQPSCNKFFDIYINPWSRSVEIDSEGKHISCID